MMGEHWGLVGGVVFVGIYILSNRWTWSDGGDEGLIKGFGK